MSKKIVIVINEDGISSDGNSWEIESAYEINEENDLNVIKHQYIKEDNYPYKIDQLADFILMGGSKIIE